MPVRMPTGIAVTIASNSAASMRCRLASVCSRRVALLEPSIAKVTNFFATAAGDGMKTGLTSSRRDAMPHAAISTITVATLIQREPAKYQRGALERAVAFGNAE